MRNEYRMNYEGPFGVSDLTDAIVLIIISLLPVLTRYLPAKAGLHLP